MKKGISVLSLAIVVMVIGILTSAIIITSSDSVKNLNKVEFVTEYMLVEEAANKYFSLNGGYPTTGEIDLTYEASSAEQFIDETVSDSTVTLQKLDIATLGFDNLVYGNGETAQDYYAVSITTGKVYYVFGFSYNDKIFYKVTEELNQDYIE